MSSESSAASEYVALPNKIKRTIVNPSTTEPSQPQRRKTNQKDASGAPASDSKPVNSAETDITETESSINADLKAKGKKESRKPHNKTDGDSAPESKEGPFGGSTRIFLIFLACIFGSMLLVWIIGGSDERTKGLFLLALQRLLHFLPLYWL